MPWIFWCLIGIVISSIISTIITRKWIERKTIGSLQIVESKINERCVYRELFLSLDTDIDSFQNLPVISLRVDHIIADSHK